MDPFGIGQHPEVIDLGSNSDSDSFLDEFIEFDGSNDEMPLANDFLDANDPVNCVDLTGLENVPDVDVPPSPPDTAHSVLLTEDTEGINEAECLQMVLNVLPDIAVDHVLTLIQERTRRPCTFAQCERLIIRILDDGAYPKENDEANKRKRKRDDDDDNDITRYENDEQDIDALGYLSNASSLLKDEFLHIPVRHIENVLREHKTLFRSYGILAGQFRDYNSLSSPFSKLSRPRVKRGIEWTLIAAESSLPRELKAARKKSEMEAEKRRKEQEAEHEEEENLSQAQANGEMDECLCCFDDFPRNRMTCCNGDAVHFFCLACAKTYVEGEMGKSKCRPVCFADTSCGGTFTRHQLLEFLGQTSFDRLEHLQQQADLAAAGLDFLDECPFCDFKAECPPVEIDKEFRCLNPKCGKTSCRLCQKETHIPLKCEEAKRDGNITIRHVVEEAMSSALIRYCNRCKHPFVKEHGCNKMSCSHCQNTQCYVCSKNVTNYDHFGDMHHPNNSNRCPLHDNVEARHEEEVKKAAAEALAKVRAEHPHISETDLMIQVSDRVKQAEDARRGRADVEHNQFPFHMVGHQLVEVPVRLGQEIGHGLLHHPPRPIAHPGVPLMPLRPGQVAHPLPLLPFPAQAGLNQYYNPFLAEAPAAPHQIPPQRGDGFRNLPYPVFNVLPLRAQAAAHPAPQLQQQQQQQQHPHVLGAELNEIRHRQYHLLAEHRRARQHLMRRGDIHRDAI